MKSLNIFYLISLVFLQGCAAVGVISSSDPYTKLRDANGLYHYNRPLPSERLFLEALDIFISRNDELGMAQTYRDLGWFYKSQAVENHSVIYKEHGFRDKSVTYENRFEASVRCFEKSVELFKKLEIFDALTNAQMHLGYSYQLLGDMEKACRSFEASIQSYNKNIQKNPDAKVNIPKEFKTYEEYARNYMEKVACK